MGEIKATDESWSIPVSSVALKMKSKNSNSFFIFL